MRQTNPSTMRTKVMLRESAFERLRKLPQTFSLEQMCLLSDLDKPQALKYVSRWTQSGMLATAGPRVGFYANLVVAPQLAQQSQWRDLALLHVYPTAVIAGISALNAAGWTTQHPHQTHVAVLAPANRACVDGFDITPRPRRWYGAVHEGIERAVNPGDLARLEPAWALADLWSRDDAWHPDPDDLDLPDDLSEVEYACRQLGVDDWREKMEPRSAQGQGGFRMRG
jgi:predicted transcriptional regulator of viral defense system